MKYLKRSNEVIYIDFTNKDYMELVSKYRPEVYKVSIIICNLFWLPKTVDNIIKLYQIKEEYRPDLKIVLYTGISRHNHNNDYRINRIIRLSFPKVWRNKIKIQGGMLDINENGHDYCFWRKEWLICVDKCHSVTKCVTLFTVEEDLFSFCRSGGLLKNKFYSFVMKEYNHFAAAAVENVGHDMEDIYDEYLNIMLDALIKIDNKKPEEELYGFTEDGKPILIQRVQQ